MKERLVRLLIRIWNSPTYTTIASVVARAFAIGGPVPFLYAAFSLPVVAFWLAVTTFQSIVGAFNGVMPVIAMQMTAYANAGSMRLGGTADAHAEGRSDEPNWRLMGEINKVSRRAFTFLAVAWVLFAATIGTISMWRLMQSSGNLPLVSWTWGLFIVGATFRVLQQPYAAFLLGRGHVAVVRRLEAGCWFLGGFAAIVVLVLSENLLLTMATLQAPILLNYTMLAITARRDGWATIESTGEAPVWQEFWSRGWRGGIGIFTAILTQYGSGLIYAQAGDSHKLAGYLFGLNILGIVSQIAISPIFGVAPRWAAAYSRGDLRTMNMLAHRVLAQSAWLFALLALVTPLSILVLNQFLTHPIGFPGPGLWLAMCAASMVARHAGNHLQYYTATNDIRLHIINPIFLVCSLGPFLFLPSDDVLLFVYVQLAAATLVYFPYARRLTAMHLRYPLQRDVTDLGLPLAAMGCLLGAWAVFA